jgi:WhiB family redox-sensing transcriptional regulator
MTTRSPNVFVDLRGQEWMDGAPCAETDPEVFFPEALGYAESTRRARDICHGCPVQVACLSFALTHDERHGIWAGTTPDQRQAMTRGATA